MDEPTAALGVKETAAVIDVIRRINEQGLAIILISHNLPQVVELSDRIMVLRAGQTGRRGEDERHDRRADRPPDHRRRGPATLPTRS
jgi:simple sugar transport system ATP-binding protein